MNKSEFKKEFRNLVCDYDSYTIDYPTFEKKVLKLIEGLKTFTDVKLKDNLRRIIK